MIPEAGGMGAAEDLEEQRLKNNLAVRRSRMKSRQKMSHMVDRCGKLRKENDLLELKANALMKELAFLKEMFLTHASGKKQSAISQADLDRIMSDEVPGPEIGEQPSSSQEEEEEEAVRATRLQEGERVWLPEVTSP